MKYRILSSLLFTALFSFSVQAGDYLLRTEQIAATCMSCHPAHTGSHQAMIRLYNRPSKDTARALLAFRDGERQGKLMNDVSKGLSLQQIERLSHYFSKQP